MRKVFLALGLAVTATVAGACDAVCLAKAMDGFLEKMVAHRAKDIELSPQALVYVNTRPTAIEQHPLNRARVIKSKQVFRDAVSGNVVARTGVEMEDGRIAYVSMRLKVAGGKVSEVETSFDDSPRVVASYVTQLDPVMTTVVRPGERMSRGALTAVVARYFQALSDHQPAAADFDDNCDRYHSGQRITNNARNSVEGGRSVTCFSSLGGNPPWGPATDVHIPVVDPEHGIVVGYTLLLYKNDTPPMYVSEVFRIVGGKIRRIDNIGLKAEGLRAMNFPE